MAKPVEVISMDVKGYFPNVPAEKTQASVDGVIYSMLHSEQYPKTQSTLDGWLAQGSSTVLTQEPYSIGISVLDQAGSVLSSTGQDPYSTGLTQHDRIGGGNFTAIEPNEQAAAP